MNKWKVFGNEINLISDSKLKEFVKKSLNRAYEGFYVDGASRDHHHKEKEGLVRHIKEAVYIAREKVRQYKYSQYYSDLLISTLLLHDITKSVNEEDISRFKYYTHPLTVRVLLYDLAEGVGHKDFNIIMNGIESHMGIWWGHTRHPETQFERDVYDCDYFASRVNIKIPIIGENIKLGRQHKEGNLEVEV